MLPPRGTDTDRLIDVIEVIQLGRKSGRLFVTRGEGTKAQEGAVTFVNGQVVDAIAGHLRSQQAFQWLSSWSACRFSFVPAAGERATGPLTKGARGRATIKLSTTQPYMPAVPSQSPGQTSTGEERLQAYISAPQRIRSVEEASFLLERAGLSRLHLRVLLLLDGHRTPTEVARLVGRHPDEIQRYLDDLEYIGVIR